jgi:hypothetical protein
VDTNVSEEHSLSIFRAEDGGSMFLRNVGVYLQDHAALQHRKTNIYVSWKGLLTCDVWSKEQLKKASL